ncbi:9871_t:CDS:1 [Funneliformis geosporum]|uniref:3163_t:CDS:1 n=1 Tax=Funneliformis geosporum TaxID=1117311 RepID=A0A9W4T4R2_9GLOM|nr:3163_t:CDS:1 [Funneliformis geosporum]CAI2194916.1 9871_t:CDS:1 [Funneliformis geosporum]
MTSSKETFIQNYSSLRVLFVFDEVRQLMGDVTGNRKLANNKETPFINLRRATRWLPSKSGIFFALLDTTSRIANLASPAKLDPSARVAGDGRKLFPPLYHFGYLDVNLKPVYGLKLEEAFNPEILFRYGRPLWSSLIDRDSMERIRKLAASKLVGGGNRFIELWNNKYTKSMHQLEALSILRSRFPFYVCRSDISSELIAGYLSWCLFISEDRWLVNSTMPSEAVIAEAGACWMSKPKILDELLEHLIKAVTSGCIDAGQGGEISAQILAILARDKVALRINTPLEDDIIPFMSSPIFLKEFLRDLLNSSIVDGLAKRSSNLSKKTKLTDIIECGKIAFTHFVYVDRIPNIAEMLMLFSRGAAICCRRGQPGSDLIVIVLLPNENNQYLLQEQYITYLLIQVKNYHNRAKDPEYKSSATTKLSTAFTGLDQVPRHLYLSMYMGFGGKMAWHEFPEPEIAVKAQANMNDYLVRGPKYNLKIQELRSSNLSPADIETIRRHRQISFAILGFDAELYPCVFQENSQHDRQKSHKLQGLKDSATSKSKRLARIWGGNGKKQFTTELNPETTRIVSYIYRLLQSFPDPVSFHSEELEKKLVRNMATPMYLDALSVNDDAAIHDNFIEAIIENDDDD